MTLKERDETCGSLENRPYLSRRQFLKATAAGAAAVCLVPSIALGSDTRVKELKSRVVRINHPHLINADEKIDPEYARQSVDRAIRLLSGEKRMTDAWKRVFPRLTSNDTIGIKVNCVNGKCPTHPEITYAVAQSVIDALGLDPNNIIIWDRSMTELKRAGYIVNTSEKGVRCFGTLDSFSAVRWILNMRQDESDGIGYDKGHAYDVGGDTTIHLSNILTRMCTQLINMPVLKDHRLAGITLSLKNHFGAIDNPGGCHSNYCDPFIANLNAIPQIRKKTKLVMCDAAFCVYEGGPRGAPNWQPKSILASLDPVALDYTGMQMINGQREKNDLDPVTRMAVHLKTAQALGLGTCNPRNIELIEGA